MLDNNIMLALIVAFEWRIFRSYFVQLEQKSNILNKNLWQQLAIIIF